MKRPELFWVAAGAPLTSVILSTLIVFLVKGQTHGISIIGQLNHGLNPPSWDMLTFDKSYMGIVIRTGLVTGIIALTEGVAVGRTFASLKDYQVDGNKEMMAFGIMNIVGSCTSCFVTSGSFSRSAVNNNAGCKTAMSNIVMALTVMVTLLFLMPLFIYTPNVVLSTIILTAVIGLIDITSAYQIWRMDKMDFLVCMCAFFGTIIVSVQNGLAIAVGLSILRILMQITRPKMAILGNIPGSRIYRNLHHYREATRVPGFLIIAVEGPINFANTTYITERITRMLEEEAEEKQAGLQYLIVDLSAVSSMDTNGISFIMDTQKSMKKRGVEVVFVNPLADVMDKLQKANGIHDFLSNDSFYLTVGEAILSLTVVMKGPV